MVKSLLLGTAAGLVAVAGAQAADLPVKAKAVEYVKVCSLYGAGFYYIPGTDTCIKIGGFMRTEWNHNANGSFATQTNGANAFYTRSQDSLVNRSRVIMSFDVRSQTEYGTLRSYARAGWQWTTNTDSIGGSASTVYLDRVFIQFAGFTFGKTQSFFDTPGIENMTYQTEEFRNNTGGSGTPVFAYTALLGNGVSATLSLEDASERRANIVNLSVGNPFAIGVSNTSNNAGNKVPDIVANLRVDQAWGSAGISGALHNNSARYYGASVASGHADDKWGWAVGAGVVLKAPWNAKDTFALSAQYGQGASTYTFNVPGSFSARSLVANMVQDGGISLAWGDDAYYSGVVGSQLELSKTFSISGGFEHYWTNSLRSSIWGTYTNYEANSAAVNTQICAVRGFSPDCADWSAFQVGSRTIWNPVSNLDIGLEVMYTKINTAFGGGVAGAINTATANFDTIPAGLSIKDNDVWSGILRVQRNFWP